MCNVLRDRAVQLYESFELTLYHKSCTLESRTPAKYNGNQMINKRNRVFTSAIYIRMRIGAQRARPML